MILSIRRAKITFAELEPFLFLNLHCQKPPEYATIFNRFKKLFISYVIHMEVLHCTDMVSCDDDF